MQMSRNLSLLRQKFWRAYAALARTLRQLQRDQPMVQGSFYLLRRKCGKTSCACASRAALHSSKVISWTSAGRKRLRVLSPREQIEMVHLVERHRRLRRARVRLVKLQAEILVVVDKLEVLRRQEP